MPNNLNSVPFKVSGILNGTSQSGRKKVTISLSRPINPQFGEGVESRSFTYLPDFCEVVGDIALGSVLQTYNAPNSTLITLVRVLEN